MNDRSPSTWHNEIANCDRADARQVIAAMKQAHPYEEVAYDIYQLLDEDEL